jgi:hypothetical protein
MSLSTRQQRFLQQKYATTLQNQPRATELRKVLLDHGGEEVSFPAIEEDLLLLLTRGELLSPKVIQVREGARGQCHFNSCAEWFSDEGLSITTGYVLDGAIWRQHSWCVNDDVLVETTFVREMYFGALLTHEEALTFVEENYT